MEARYRCAGGPLHGRTMTPAQAITFLELDGWIYEFDSRLPALLAGRPLGHHPDRQPAAGTGRRDYLVAGVLWAKRARWRTLKNPQIPSFSSEAF